jgi:two-component system sensor histidine kinase MtrB
VSGASLDEVLKTAWARARAVWGRAFRQLKLFLATAEHTWRRSLQVRVVTLTLVVSSLLVAVFAYVVAYRSSTILLDRAKESVSAQLDSGRSTAEEQLSPFGKAYEPNVQGTIKDLVFYLSGGESQDPSSRLVVVKADGVFELSTVKSRDSDIDRLLTDDITREVDDGRKATAIRSADLAGTGLVKYLVEGTPVNTSFGQVQLYYVEPLTPQDSAATQIRTTVLATGATLVLLLGLLSALVTRLVVRPVRVAARTAQRLSAGLLDQRMAVTGEDDLALLAASFNQMAANLQRQIVRLEDMSRLQRRFTSDVSHELRTPLTTVRMAADLIFAERERFPADVTRTAEILQTELDRFESLLTDLLEISRYDAGFAMLDAEPTDLVPIVHRAVEPLRGLAERCGVPLAIDVPPDPVIVDADPRRVERILRNLVGNAVEHAEGKPVVIRLVSDGVAAAVAVRDHGLGLKPGEEKLVFNRFWRADPSRARQTGGTGLGLSISLEDARLHGGWLEAWGAPGQGAQFRLTLPVRAGDRLSGSPLRLVPDDIELAAVTPPVQPRAITQAPAEVPR